MANHRVDGLRRRDLAVVLIEPEGVVDVLGEEAHGAAAAVEAGDGGGIDEGGGDAGSERRELVSEGVALGAVQAPDSGQPIILFVEQQTAGGYPKIANVIAADFHSLGQLRPRDEIRFEMVSWETARRALIEQEKLIASEERLFG